MISDRVQPSRPSFARGAIFGAGSQVTAALGAWLAGIAVARWLGPAGAGAYSIALMLQLTLSALAGVGIAAGFAYRGSQPGWRHADAVRQVPLAALAFGVLGLGIGAAAVTLLRDTAFAALSTEALALTVAAVPCSLIWIYLTHLALGFEQYRLFALGAPLQTITGLVLVCILAGPFGVTGAVAGLAASHAIAAAAMTVASLRQAARPTPGWLRRAPADLWHAIAFGLKSYAYAALNFLNLRVDVLILGAVASASEVGYYAVAVSITGFAPLVPRGFAPVVLARVARLDAGSSLTERDLVTERSLKHATLLALASGIVLVLALVLIPVLYGSDFERATELGLILIPGVCALGIAGVLSATVTGRGKPELTLYAALLITPPTVVLYATLIPAYDDTGAALASTLSYLGTLLVTYVFFRRVTGMRSLATFMPGRRELRDYVRLARSLSDRRSPVPDAPDD